MLQLRDDKPGITGPGLWGLFGGKLAWGEPADIGLLRELWEELRIRVESPRLFWRVDGTNEFDPTPKRWWFFDVDATAVWKTHELHGGQATGLFTFEELPTTRMTPMTQEAIVRRHADLGFAATDIARYDLDAVVTDALPNVNRHSQPST